MNRAWILFVVATFPFLGQAQNTNPSGGDAQPYVPAVPQASMVTGYGGWPGDSGGASTVAGSALNGMASVIGAAWRF